MRGYWTCRRRSGGAVCQTHNPNRKRNCVKCGKSRAPRRRPKHLVALETSYKEFIALNGGEFCGVCGRGPGTRRLDRDHSHKTGRPRGLLCARCNRALPSWITPEWLSAAAEYLRRTTARDSS